MSGSFSSIRVSDTGNGGFLYVWTEDQSDLMPELDKTYQDTLDLNENHPKQLKREEENK